MRIASIHLKNFKRFTDLLIQEIPETAKLVVVVGPNGCGKSSLFDAFLQWYRMAAGFGIQNDLPYFQKDFEQEYNWNENTKIVLHGKEKPKKGSLYVRTAYRNDPDFKISQFSRPNIPTEHVQVARSIENDQTVSSNYQRLVYETMSGVYNEENNAKTVEALRKELIGQVASSMQNVFGDLELNSISDPLGTGAFHFKKGSISSYHYKNLSGGEKAAFDLILDLHIKKRFFTDSIYCIDEVESHLHTSIQGSLLQELASIIPENSQLWVTSHSLGVIRAAQEMVVDDPSAVCVIDFSGVDPDVPCEIHPSNLGRIGWEKMLSIALDDFSQRIAPKFIVVCEGSSIGNRRKDFDAEIYNRIFGENHSDVLFISGGSSNQVAATGISVRDLLNQILSSATVFSLADRDDRSTTEVETLKGQSTLTLPLRNIESFLFSEEVIEALVKKEEKEPQLDNALNLRSAAIDASVQRGNPQDDLKSAAGEIYTGLKKLLGLQRCGNCTDAFMRDTLAPLICPKMKTYQTLKSAIIDKLV